MQSSNHIIPFEDLFVAGSETLSTAVECAMAKMLENPRMIEGFGTTFEDKKICTWLQRQGTRCLFWFVQFYASKMQCPCGTTWLIDSEPLALGWLYGFLHSHYLLISGDNIKLKPLSYFFSHNRTLIHIPLLHLLIGYLPHHALRDLAKKHEPLMDLQPKFLKAKAPSTHKYNPWLVFQSIREEEVSGLVRSISLNIRSLINLAKELFTSNPPLIFLTDNIKVVFGTMVDRVMLEMLKNPQIMKKAQAEVRQTFETKGEVDDIGIHELKILKLVVKETPRLQSPAPLLLPRECGERFEINGCDEIPLNPMSLLLHGQLEEMEALNST
ncbi:hypothetical protein AAG906_010229 [Vitis piasezkii]